jgi:hypothetical protein
MAGRYYVYAHVDTHGEPFYVGKGTGRRAYSKDRDEIWRYYVDYHLGGDYRVEILHDGLSENDALWLEEAKITELGAQLTNRVNFGAPFDMEAFELRKSLKAQRGELKSQAMRLAQEDPKRCIELYQQAYELHKKECRIELERGLRAQLQTELDSKNGLRFADVGLVKLFVGDLMVQERYQEVIDLAEDFARTWPADWPKSKTAPVRNKRLKAYEALGETPPPLDISTSKPSIPRRLGNAQQKVTAAIASYPARRERDTGGPATGQERIKTKTAKKISTTPSPIQQLPKEKREALEDYLLEVEEAFAAGVDQTVLSDLNAKWAQLSSDPAIANAYHAEQESLARYSKEEATKMLGEPVDTVDEDGVVTEEGICYTHDELEAEATNRGRWP